MTSFTNRILTMALCAAMVAAAAPQKADSLEAMLRAAMDKESVDGDLKAAIEQYKKLIGRSGASREIVAKALVRLGLCYEKQGSAEARNSYERVVREFADQPEAVQQARGRLTAAVRPMSPEIAHRRVWAGAEVPAGFTFVGVSMDDRYLTFVQNGNIALRDLSTGETRQITRLPNGVRIEMPRLSPDAKRIAYSTVEGQQQAIGIVNVDGSGMRNIHVSSRTVVPTAWSPDSKRLLIETWTWNPGLAAFSWVNVADGGIQQITTRAANNGFGHLSPDGAYIAFAASPSPGDPRPPSDVYLIASDGTGETVLRAGSAHEAPAGWSPDGKQVIFTTDQGGSKALWAVPVANGKVQGAARLLQPSLGEQGFPAGITRSGTFYYRPAPTFSSDIFTAPMDPATGKVTAPAVALPLWRAGHNVAPRFSPDGRRLLVSWLQDVPGLPVSVKEYSVYSFDSGKELPIATKAKIQGAAWCWERNAASFLTNGPDRVTRIDLATGETSPTFPGTPAGTISCSANGDLLVFADTEHKMIGLRDMQTGAERELYKSKGNELVHPDISPDGGQVAFLRTEGNTAALLVVPASGGPEREILRVAKPLQLQLVRGLAWSPDGRHVYYLKTSGGNTPYELFRIAASGGPEESMGLKGAKIRDLNISPDGTRIAFSIGVGTNEIWAIESLFSSGK